MADCCAQLSSELAQLRAEVSKLRPIDEASLIRKITQLIKDELFPLISEANRLAKRALDLAETVERLLKEIGDIAKQAQKLAKALEPLLRLLPLLPLLLGVAAILGSIAALSIRLSAAESRLDTLEGGQSNIFKLLDRINNLIMRLQNQLNSLRLQKGDKGDRGNDGKAGYTPRKNIDYFDGSNGKDGYTPKKGTDYKDGVPGQSIKGDRGSDGKAGYTPRKNIDYFDGSNGKDGYTPKKGTDYKDGVAGQSIKGDRGSDGKAGYTPRKNIDYFDGSNGKDGYTPKKGTDYKDGVAGQSIKGDRGSDGKSIKGDRGSDGKSIKGDRGSDGKSIKGDRGSDGKSIKGDRGPIGPPGRSIKGDKGDSEMPTDLSPVLNAIANINVKVSKCNADSDRDRVRLDAIHSAINIQIEGVVNVLPCGEPLETFSYSGLGLVGLQTQLITSANQLAKVHEDICKISNSTGGGVGSTPKAEDLLDKIYAILGGSTFYPTGDETAPSFSTNAEVDVRDYANTLFNEDGSEGSPAVCNNLLDAINISNAVTYYRLGLHEFPASLPTSLVSTNDGFLGSLLPNINTDIHNLTRFLTWYVERFDEVMGQWEIPIEIKDSDPSTPGEQPVGIKLPNIAEAIAEMFTLCFQTNINSETLLNMTMRTMSGAAADQQQNFITYKLLQSLTDWVGFKQKDIKLKMPLLFTLDKSRYDEILKESEIEVSCVEFDEKFGLEADLMRFREGVAILQAVHKKKINPTGDIKAQILKYLLDTLAATNKVNKDEEEDDFDTFINDVETGFINAPGIDDPINPYGRPFTQRPRIRDLSKFVPPTTP